jgi:ribosome-binding ATPase
LYNYSMILTIFGYPKSGKTLLFNLLTNKKEKVSKFSTSTNEYHMAIVDVPDNRVTVLAEFFKSPAIHAKIEFLDTGITAFGEGQSATFIDLLRRADGLVHMVRGFEDDEILHPMGSIDPVRDIKAMEDELITVDFITVEKRLEKLALDVRKIKSKELEEELEVIKKLKAHLEENKPLREYTFAPNEEKLIKGFKFLSLKPLFNIINADEHTYETYLKLKKEPEKGTAAEVFCAKIELELLELDESDRQVFQEEYGLKNYSYMRDNFIQTSYKLMNLLSFFTVGEDECRAWTINKGDNAFTASGKIHSDIQQGFIRAETILWKDFLDSGGFSQAKEKGLLRLEGKEYIVKDGEILHFRFNK